ncbi:hypothetical protein J6590_052373 [Homalodisca vitripennis]|nr:hypothetical protein J6590_052373 [Homalodisca vitripennis]
MPPITKPSAVTSAHKLSAVSNQDWPTLGTTERNPTLDKTEVAGGAEQYRDAMPHRASGARTRSLFASVIMQSLWEQHGVHHTFVYKAAASHHTLPTGTLHVTVLPALVEDDFRHSQTVTGADVIYPRIDI